MEDSNKENWLKKVLPYSAVIIALVSAFAYIGAYIYEIAYCNHFGIPVDLIVVNWTRFFVNVFLISMVPLALLLPVIGRRWQNVNLIVFAIVFSGVASIFVLWFYCGNSYLLILPLIITLVLLGIFRAVIIRCWLKMRLEEKSCWKFVAIFLTTFAVTAFLLWFYQQILNNQTWQWTLLIVPACLGALSCLVTWTLFPISRRRLSETLPVFLTTRPFKKTEFESIPNNFSWLSGFSLFRKLQIYNCLVIGIVSFSIFSLLWLCMATGRGEAEGKVVYSLQSFPQNPSIANLSVDDLYKRNQNTQNLSDQNLVVLTIYGDKAVCAPWYRKENEAHVNESYIMDNKSFVIYSLDSIVLTPKSSIGPLHVK